VDERELIRQRVNLVDLVSQEVRLKKVGQNFEGLCPFHEDKSPSFNVSPKIQRYKCWSCGAAGDIFKWVMDRRNMDFRGALETLAQIAGVELKGHSGPSTSKRGTFERMMDAAQAFFVESLRASKEAVNYCDGRGLDEAIRAEWGLGWAPAMDEALPAALKRGGYTLEDAQSLFLVDGDPQNGYRSKFRGRLMFPIWDERGTLIAYGGRLLGDGRPKYINSGDTPIFQKSRVLYGLYQARDACTKANRAVLVEGYLDVIACHRAGVKNAVASLGTSLTDEHAKLLKRFVDEVVILYDADEAGRKAAVRAVEVLSAVSLRTKIVMLPPGEDPDTLLKKVGPEGVLRATEGGLAPTDYLLAMLQRQHAPTAPEYWESVVEILAAERDNMRVERLLMEIAPQYPGINDPLAAREALRTLIRGKQRPPETVRPSTYAKKPRFGKFDLKGPERAVFLGVIYPSLRAEVWPFATDPSLFLTPLGCRFASMLAMVPEIPTTDVGVWIHSLEPEEDRLAFADFLLTSADAVDQVVVKDAVAKLLQEREKSDLRKGWQATGPKSDDDLREINKRLGELKGVEPKPPDDGLGF
jgi:DNA primase